MLTQTYHVSYRAKPFILKKQTFFYDCLGLKQVKTMEMLNSLAMSQNKQMTVWKLTNIWLPSLKYMTAVAA